METRIIMKQFITWLVLAIFIAPIAFAGVTSPLPSNMELKKGDSGRFKFQVQAVNSDSDLVCTYKMQGQPPFAVEFDTQETVVAAGSRDNVYGTLTISEEASAGVQTSDFCVSCRPVDAPAGASVNVDTCGLTLKATVVEERTRDNLFVPEKPVPAGFPWTTVLIVAGLISLLVIAFWLFCLGRKKKRHTAYEAPARPAAKPVTRPKKTAAKKKAAPKSRKRK